MTQSSPADPQNQTDEQIALEIQRRAEEMAAVDAQEIREEVFSEAGWLIDDVLDEARRRFADREHSLEDLLTFIRIEVGLEHARGPHHRAPGLYSRVQGEG